MERDRESGEGCGVKDSWSNGCKAINRVKNSPLWSGSMNEDILRPFSPAHKHLFGVRNKKRRGRRWRKMRGGGRAGEGERKVVGCGLSLTSTHF